MRAPDTGGRRPARRDSGPAVRGLLLAIVAAIGLPATAFGHEPPRVLDPDSRSFERVVGEEVRPTKGGLFDVEVRGPDVYTHGPDVNNDFTASHGTSLGPGDPERPPACVQPGSGGYAQHVLYAYQGTANELAAHVADIRSAIQRMNAVLNTEALESGGVNADYRVLCDAGVIRVDAFQVTGTSFSDHVSAARLAGYSNLRRDYTIFSEVPGSGACGVGSIYDDPRPLASNANNNDNSVVTNARAGYGITFDGCWDTETPMHENGHNQGAVQLAAPPEGPPHTTGTGMHCWDEVDVMCYSPDGGSIHQQGTVTLCSDGLHFDCGHDDYFDPLTEEGEPYLDDHWNIGAEYNNFIVYDAPGSNGLPNAAFDVTCEATTCAFVDRSIDPDAGDSIAGWDWSFGDGGQSLAASPSHAYAAPGSYVVTLTVTDESGASAQATRTVALAEPSQTRRLENSVAVDGNIGAAGSWRDFTIRVPRRERKLVVSLDGPACTSPPCADDMDLYVRYGAHPELSAWRCRPFQRDSDERCAISSPRSGWWYTSVHNYDASAGAPFRLTARHR